MESITLTNAILGLKPYVLIEVEGFKDDGKTLEIDVDLGGGVTRRDLRALLSLVLQQLGDDDQAAEDDGVAPVADGQADADESGEPR
ncbi:hypothetical protein Val02_81870 [Virgisporangium aliadipatigenens]|uniref:Uncharacterized protein n=1 Tax=Virgisporangium aliadipatigenens TaxID=741659 RepID=A0A8J3YTL2_9ACTN|nr:hypothetical protein [Virgisporangium aliadipatigenens]GIJ51301.1 hypothetical protein Val02_81870 [Virgisporangium aliadipatigenens]